MFSLEYHWQTHTFLDFPDNQDELGIVVPQDVYYTVERYERLRTIRFRTNGVLGVNLNAALNGNPPAMDDMNATSRLSGNRISIRINVSIYITQR